MSWSRRNVLGEGGARKLSAIEAAFNENDRALYGFQPFGTRVGKSYAVTTEHLLNPGFNWIHTMVDGGTAAAQVIAVQDPASALGPFFKVTTNSTQHDNNQFQYAIAKTAGSTTLSAYGPFVAKAGYDIHFEFDFRITTTVANAAFMCGLVPVDTTMLSSSAIDVTSLIGFYKAASATMGGVVRTSSTSTTTALTVNGTSGWTPTINTWYRIGFTLRGRDSIVFWVDGERTGSTTMTNLPANTVVLCPSFVIGAATGAVATMDVRGFFCGQEVQ